MPTLYRCKQCREFSSEEELVKFKDLNELYERVASGQQLPGGYCPSCGMFCYPIFRPDGAWLTRLEQIDGTMRRGLAELRTFVIDSDLPLDVGLAGAALEHAYDMFLRILNEAGNIVVLERNPPNPDDEEEIPYEEMIALTDDEDYDTEPYTRDN